MVGIADQLTVSFCNLGFPGRGFMFEEQINLAETATFRFWQAEPAPDVTK
jgi:hypothetical protein